MDSRLILVGRVAGAFGVRGEVRLTTYTEEPMALARYRDLKREDGAPALTVTTARPAKGGIIARCPEIASKEAADGLRGLRLYVPRAVLPAVEEDEFYLADLVGLSVESPAGEPLGKVRAVHNFGAGDVIELDPGGGRPTVFLPFTREAVPEISLAEGRMVAVLPVETDEAPEGDVG